MKKTQRWKLLSLLAGLLLCSMLFSACSGFRQGTEETKGPAETAATTETGPTTAETNEPGETSEPGKTGTSEPETKPAEPSAETTEGAAGSAGSAGTPGTTGGAAGSGGTAGTGGTGSTGSTGSTAGSGSAQQGPAQSGGITIVTELSKTMYANAAVNVRSGDSVKYAKIGALTFGQAVTVTGRTSTGWYRIDYSGTTAYVSDAYLQDVKPAAPAPAGNKAETILNSATLSPRASTGYEPLDELLAEIFSKILTPDMSTYQKVKACYDYLIRETTYGHGFYGFGQEAMAYGVLKEHVGVCDDYSAAFRAMMLAIGLDCHVVGGKTKMSAGGYGGHAWCLITVGGVDYVFDAQIEDDIAKGGTINYYRFCKTYDELPGAYIQEQVVA